MHASPQAGRACVTNAQTAWACGANTPGSRRPMLLSACSAEDSPASAVALGLARRRASCAHSGASDSAAASGPRRPTSALSKTGV